MATAHSPRQRVRDRSTAVPFRLLWPALLLLFAVLMAHGASTESAETATGRSAVAAASSPQASAAGEAHDPHPAPAHPAELCVSGQPQQGAELPLPCAAPVAGAPLRMPLPGGRSGAPGAAPDLPPPRNAAGSVVQQV